MFSEEFYEEKLYEAYEEMRNLLLEMESNKELENYDTDDVFTLIDWIEENY